MKNKQRPAIAVWGGRQIGQLLHMMQIAKGESVFPPPRCLGDDDGTGGGGGDTWAVEKDGARGRCRLLDVGDAALEDSRAFKSMRGGAILYYVLDESRQQVVAGWDEQGRLVVPSHPVELGVTTSIPASRQVVLATGPLLQEIEELRQISPSSAANFETAMREMLGHLRSAPADLWATRIRFRDLNLDIQTSPAEAVATTSSSS